MGTPIMVHIAYPNRWGPGKVHISGGPYRDTMCAGHIHGRRRLGQLTDVTCKKCLRMLTHG